MKSLLMVKWMLMASISWGMRHELVIVSENSSVFIGCNLDNEDVRWMRNGDDISKDELYFHVVVDDNDQDQLIDNGATHDNHNHEDLLRHFRMVSRFLPESGRHVLRIQNVSHDRDSGQYNCRPAINTFINGHDDDYDDQVNALASPKWNVMVLEKVGCLSVYLHNDTGFFEMPHLYDSEKQVLEVYEKESEVLELLCVHIDSSSTVHWSSSSSSMSLEVREERQLLQNSDQSAFLTTIDISEIERSEDNLELKCVSDMESTEKKSAVQLLIKVLYPPTFTISRTPRFGHMIKVGMTVSLVCHTDVEVADLRWIKDNGLKTSNSSTLLFVRINEEDQGWYQCLGHVKHQEYASLSYFLRVQSHDEGRDEGRDEGQKMVLDSLLLEEEEQMEEAIDTESGQELNQKPMLTLSSSLLSSSDVNVSVRVCSNPPVDRLLWFTSIFVLRPGDVRDGLEARAGRRCRHEPVCVNFDLIIKDDVEKEVGVVAENAFGVVMTDLQLATHANNAQYTLVQNTLLLITAAQFLLGTNSL